MLLWLTGSRCAHSNHGHAHVCLPPGSREFPHPWIARTCKQELVLGQTGDRISLQIKRKGGTHGINPFASVKQLFLKIEREPLETRHFSLARPLESSIHQRLPGGEVVRYRPQRDAGGLGNRAMGDGLEAPGTDQRHRRVKDPVNATGAALARGNASVGHCAAPIRYRTIVLL